MSYITEEIDEYVDGINSLDDLYTYSTHRIVYQRTGKGISLSDKAAVNKLLNNFRGSGLSREFGGGNGEAYGQGLYTSLTLKDCQDNDGTQYGHIILKVWLSGFDRCLIDPGCHKFGTDLAVQVHGQDSSLYSQCVKLMGEAAASKYKGCRTIRQLITCTPEDIFQEYDIDGIVYDWFSSGHWVCVWKDYKKAFPLAYSLDQGKTFHKLGDENTLKCTLQTWEPRRVLGSDFNNYYKADDARVENGYMLVNNDNGYNYIDPKLGKTPISSVWFDLATPIDDNGMGTVKYHGQKFWYYAPNDEIYAINGTDTEEALMMDDPLGTSADLPTIASSQSMTENTQVLAREVNESVSEYIAGFDRSKVHDRGSNGLAVFYRLSLPEQLKSIATNGFSKEFRGTGNDNTDWVGSGTYGCVDSHWRTGKYGSILWAYGTPAQLVADTYISPNPYLAKRFGIKGTFAEQLERFFPDLVPKWKRMGVWKTLLKPGYYDEKASSDYGFDVYSGSSQMKRLNAIVFCGDKGRSDHFYHAHGINGIIYHGNGDGDAVLTFDDSTIIPLAWRNNARYGSKWNKVDVSDTLWDRTFNGYDPLPFLKGTFQDYSNDPNYISHNYRVINGYMLVCKKDCHKYNYVKAPEGGRNFASSVWFDLATPIDDNGMGTVKYHGQKFWYYAPNDEIYAVNGTDTEEALMMDDPLGTSADLPAIASSQSMDEGKRVFGTLLDDVLKKS